MNLQPYFDSLSCFFVKLMTLLYFSSLCSFDLLRIMAFGYSRMSFRIIPQKRRYCEVSLLHLSCSNGQSDGKRTPLRVRDRLGNDPQWVPWFFESLFVDVRGTATEQVRSCGFRRISSSIDKAPKIRHSVRLNSFEGFLFILPSMSSETWEMYSWAISGSSVFCDWLFLVFFQVFFLKLLLISSYSSKFPWYWGENSVSSEGWIQVFFVKSTVMISSFHEGKRFQ